MISTSYVYPYVLRYTCLYLFIVRMDEPNKHVYFYNIYSNKNIDKPDGYGYNINNVEK